MSKTYTCRVKRDLSELIREKDRVVYRLRLLPVGDREKMKDWFRQALTEDGAKGDQRKLHFEIDGVQVEVDLEEDQIRIVSESTQDLHIEKDEERKIYNVADDERAAQQKAEEQVDQEIEREVREARDRIRKQAAQRLREAEVKVKSRIRKAENEAIKKALDEKAHSLGEVLDVEESEEINGDKRIAWRIRLS